MTNRMQLTFYLMVFALKYEHVSAVESAPDGSSEAHLHLRFKLMVHLSLQLSCT